MLVKSLIFIPVDFFDSIMDLALMALYYYKLNHTLNTYYLRFAIK
jgi:hypothetical protein